MIQFKQLFSFLTPQKKGTDKHPDPMKVGRAAYKKITSHGKDVNPDHLPFSQAIGQFGWFTRPNPPGSIVVGIPAGNADGYVFPLGMLTGIFDGSQYDKALDTLKEAGEIELNIKIPPNLTTKLETNITGISKWTKEIEEKGEKFKSALLKGLPNDNTAYELLGNQLKPLTGIQTGLDQAITALDSNKITAAGMQFLDVMSLLSKLDINGLSTSSQTTLNNATKLLQEDKSSAQPEWGAMAGTPININGLVQTLQKMMDSVLKETDVLSVLGEMTSNTAQSNTTITITTPFGTLSQNVSSEGVVYNLDDTLEKMLGGLQDILQNIGQGSNGQTLFSKEGTQFTEIAGRLKDLEKQLNIHNFFKDLTDDFNEKKKRGRTAGTKAGNVQACRKQVIEKREVVMINGQKLTFRPIEKE